MNTETANIPTILTPAGDVLPDFSKIASPAACPMQDDCLDTCYTWWTPRNAALLYTVAGDIEYRFGYMDRALVREILPPASRRHASKALAHRFSEVLCDIRRTIVLGRIPFPRTLAEHITFYYVLRQAEDRLSELPSDPAACRAGQSYTYLGCPVGLTHRNMDYDFDALLDFMCEDHDFTDLYEVPARSGIDSPWEMMCVSKKPDTWFADFWGNEPDYTTTDLRLPHVSHAKSCR